MLYHVIYSFIIVEFCYKELIKIDTNLVFSIQDLLKQFA